MGRSILRGAQGRPPAGALDVDVVAEAVLLLVVVGVDVELAVVDGELQIITLDVTTSWYGEGS